MPANEKHPGLIGSFYKIKDTYYYNRNWNSTRLRISTKQKTFDAAVEWVMDHPFGSRHVRKPVQLTRQFAMRLLHQARHNAKVRELPFTLTLDDFNQMYEEAKGHCQVSGLPFDLTEMENIARRPYAPSIDRLDCLSGYHKNNCRLVCSAVNLAMNEFGEKVLWNIASSMVILRTRKPRAVKK
jgi:hypothetical protein